MLTAWTTKESYKQHLRQFLDDVPKNTCTSAPQIPQFLINKLLKNFDKKKTHFNFNHHCSLHRSRRTFSRNIYDNFSDDNVPKNTCISASPSYQYNSNCIPFAVTSASDIYLFFSPTWSANYCVDIVKPLWWTETIWTQWPILYWACSAPRVTIQVDRKIEKGFFLSMNKPLMRIALKRYIQYLYFHSLIATAHRCV